MGLKEDVRALEQSLDPNDPETKELLAELHQVLQRNPLQGFSPNPPFTELERGEGKSAQHQFLEASTAVKAFFGGNRAGKTTIGTVDDLIQAVDPDCLPDHLRQFKKWEPPFFGRVVAPAVASSLEGVIYPAFRLWCPKDQLKGNSFDKAFRKDTRMLHFKNGSWIQFMTSKMDLEDFGGAALHRVRYDEEPREDIRKECRMRLIDYGGDELFCMTPLQGLTWTYHDVYERRHEDHITVVRADMDSNPHLTEDSKRLALEQGDLSKEEIQARKEGKFVALQGFVFSEFADHHVVDPPHPKQIKGQNVIVGIDPGIRWTGVVWVAFDNDNGAIVFDEMKVESATVETVAHGIRERNKAWGVEPDYYVIDPSARNRSQASVTAEGVESAFQRLGIYTTHGQNDLEAGIFQIKRRLQAGSLLISRKCVEIIWEIQHQQQDKNSEIRFAVIKHALIHLVDALRYVCMARAWGAPTVWNPNRDNRRYTPGVAPDMRGFMPPVSVPPMGPMS